MAPHYDRSTKGTDLNVLLCRARHTFGIWNMVQKEHGIGVTVEHPLRQVVGYEDIDRPAMAPSKVEVLECGHHGRIVSTNTTTWGNKTAGQEPPTGCRPCPLCK